MAILSRERALESLLDLSGPAVARTRPELIGTALRFASRLVDAAGAAALIQRGRQLHRFLLQRDMLHPEETERGVEGHEGLSAFLRRGQPLMIAEAETDEGIGPTDRFPGLAGPALIVPLRLKEGEAGHLGAYRQRGAPEFIAEDMRVMTLLGAWTAMALENLRLAESVERLAVTDDLTQVYNFRFLKAALRREIKRASRFKQDLSIIMIDVDNLKGYNDRHGHLRGSFLLREIARVLAAQVRSWDLVAKYGGDEFTIILPQTGESGAFAAAERLRAAVADQTFPLAAKGEITISLGVASFPSTEDSASGLLEVADRALYVAKQRGRNRVEPVGRVAA